MKYEGVRSVLSCCPKLFAWSGIYKYPGRGVDPHVRKPKNMIEHRVRRMRILRNPDCYRVRSKVYLFGRSENNPLLIRYPSICHTKNAEFGNVEVRRHWLSLLGAEENSDHDHRQPTAQKDPASYHVWRIEYH